MTLRAAGREETLVGRDILVAAGRIPTTAGIGLEEAGVALDARGYIRVNERLETSASGVWALGECAGSPQFTHISVDDFRIIPHQSHRGASAAQAISPCLIASLGILRPLAWA